MPATLSLRVPRTLDRCVIVAGCVREVPLACRDTRELEVHGRVTRFVLPQRQEMAAGFRTATIGDECAREPQAQPAILACIHQRAAKIVNRLSNISLYDVIAKNNADRPSRGKVFGER